MNRLRKLREKNNLKAIDVAKLLNVSLRTYYNIENEQSALSTRMIDKLSKIYDVTSDYLLGLVDFNTKESSEEKEKNILISSLSEIFN